MRFSITVNNSDLTDKAMLEKTQLKRGLSGKVATCSLTLASTTENPVTLNTLDTVTVRNADTNAIEFAGVVAKLDYDHAAPGVDYIKVQCQDYTVLLDSAIVNHTYTGQTDKQIIQAAFAEHLPEIDTSAVQFIAGLAKFEAKDVTLRKLMDDLCSLTNCEWWLDFDKKLHYQLETFPVASFSVSDNPDGVSSFGAIFNSYSKDYTARANRVTLLAGNDPASGSEIKVTVNDTANQTAVGRVYAKTVVERSITNAAVAELKAQSELTRRVNPTETGTFITDKDGLQVGQEVFVQSSAYGLNGLYLIREITTKQIDPERTRYTVQFGDSQRSLLALFKFLTKAAENTTIPQSTGVTTPPNAPDIDSLSVTVSQTEIDSVLFYQLDFSYVVPSASADESPFEGVYIHVDENGVKTELGYKPATKAAGQTESFTIYQRLPASDTTWDFYLSSNENTPVWKPSSNPSPNVSVNAKARPLALATIPNVRVFKAGTVNPTTGVYTAVMHWEEPLRKQQLVDYGCALPDDLTNFGGLQIYIKIPDGQGGFSYVATPNIVKPSEFRPTTDGIHVFQDTIAIEGTSLPNPPQNWTFIAASLSRSGVVNTDEDGNPTGPSVTLSTLPPAEIPDFQKPDPPASGDWYLDSPPETRLDAAGTKMTCLRATVTAKPAGVKFFSGWYYIGASAPTDPKSWIHFSNTVVATTGNTVLEKWFTTPLTTTEKYWVCVLPRTQYVADYPDGTFVVKSVDFAPASAPASAPTNFGVSLVTSGAAGGIGQFQFKYSFDKPSTLDYHHTEIQRVWCNSDFTIAAGATWGTVFGESEPRTTPDSLAFPDTAQYWRYRARYVNKTMQAGPWTAELTLTISKNTGFSMAQVDTTTLGNGVTVTDGKLTLKTTTERAYDAQGNLKVAGIDLSKALGTTYNTAELTIVNGKMQINGLDLTKAIASKLDSELGTLVTGKFGVKSVSAEKITAGYLAAGVIYTGSLTADQILSGTIASNILYAGTINASQINAGTLNSVHLNAGTITLNLNGIQTVISNGYETATGTYVGLKITENYDPYRWSHMYAGGLTFGCGSAKASMYVVGGTAYGRMSLTNSSGTETIIAQGDSGGIAAKGVSISSGGTGFGVAGYTVIDADRILKNCTVTIRQFSQGSRPTLTDGEVAMWYDTVASVDKLIWRHGSNHWVANGTYVP